MRTLVTVGLFGFASVAAHAIVSTSSKTAALGPDAAWSYVGKMSGCSAVAVGPHTILTAGHVTAGNFLLGSQTYRMTSTEMAPSINRKAVDLRLVTVADTLPGWYQIAKSVSTKSTVTMVGYGATGVVNAAGTGYSITGGNGTRRAGTNTIDTKTTYDPGPSLISMLEKSGESALAGGDSGGGWFVGGQLVGISAFTLSTSTSKPDYGFASKAYFGSGAIDLTNSVLQNWLAPIRLSTRTSRGIFGDFAGPGLDLDSDFGTDLDSGLGSDFDVDGDALGGSPQAVPEPASMAALGLGAVVMLRRKRSAK